MAKHSKGGFEPDALRAEVEELMQSETYRDPRADVHSSRRSGCGIGTALVRELCVKCGIRFKREIRYRFARTQHGHER